MEELGFGEQPDVIVDGTLEPERGWNAGFNVTSKFKLGFRDADFALMDIDRIPKPRGGGPRRRRACGADLQPR